jgi:O-antigen/teichoic acid export membrane protein
MAFLSRGGGAVLSLAVHVSLARWAGPAVYGTYSFAVAWVSTLAILVGAGFPEAALRFIPTYEVKDAWSRLRGLVRRGEQLALLLGTGLAAIGSISVWIVTDAASESAQAVIIGLWALPAVALVRFYTEACRSVDQITAAYVAPTLLRPGLLVAGIVALAVLPAAALTGPLVTALFGAAYLPIAAYQRASFHRYLSARTSSGNTFQFDTRRWAQVAFPLLLVTGFVMLLQKIDLILVGWMMGMKAAGFYQAAVTVAMPVSFVLGAVNAVAAPRFARFYAQDNPVMLRRFVRKLAHWLFWPALGLSFVLAGGATMFLDLLGSEFAIARLPLFLLILSHLVNAGSGSVGYLLNMTGHHLDSARVYGLTTLLHVGITAAGIQLLGLVGAAAATALSMLTWNVWLHAVVRRRLGVDPSILGALYSSE